MSTLIAAQPVFQRVVDHKELDDDQWSIMSGVSATSPLVADVLGWIDHHPNITLKAKMKTKGFSSTVAPYPYDGPKRLLITAPLVVELNLNPNSGGVTKSRAHMTETIIHEINLHLVPWARVMMHKELKALAKDPTAQNAYPADQLQRILRTFGQSGSLATDVGRSRAATDIGADWANISQRVLAGMKFGNHSDVGLWLNFLRHIQSQAKHEPTPVDAWALVAVALEKSIDPMNFTGHQDYAIVRNTDAIQDCNAVLDKLQADYVEKKAPPVQDIAPEIKRAMDNMGDNISFVRKRLLQYEAKADESRQQGFAASYTNPHLYELPSNDPSYDADTED